MMRKKISRYKSKKVFQKSYKKNNQRRAKQRSNRQVPRGGFRL